jgi:hypothetical protein
VREVVKEVLRSHTVPRLAAEAERQLWLHFVAEAVVFERRLAEVRRVLAIRTACGVAAPCIYAERALSSEASQCLSQDRGDSRDLKL